MALEKKECFSQEMSCFLCGKVCQFVSLTKLSWDGDAETVGCELTLIHLFPRRVPHP